MSKKLLTILAIATAVNSTAQTDSAKTQQQLDDVVVSATKFPVKTTATGKVITVITKEQLEKNGGKDLSQILNEQIGLYINGANSNAGKDKSVYLRGASVEHTLICVDGIPTYDASGIGGNFDLRNISIDLIERVEILKGSQSTLYGSDAVAGVINIITKKPNAAKPFTANALASYGTNNSVKGNIDINGTVSKVFSYTAGYSYFKTDGIDETINTATNADKDGYKQESFVANFNVKANQHLTIKPFLRYTWLRGSVDQAAFIDELDYTYNQKSFATGVKNELQLGKAKVNVLYSYNSIERHYIDDSTLSRNGFDIYSNTSYNGKEHFVDAYSNIKLCNSLNLTVGADYRASTVNQNYISVGYFGTTKTSMQGDSIKQNQLGVYAAINLNNQKGFNIELGTRLNNHSVYGQNWVFNINPSYTVNDDVKVFANISSAYRTPSLYQLYSEYGNKNLKPEIGVTAEIGLQHYLLDKTVKLRTVFYWRKLTDVIFFSFNPTTYVAQYINQDKQNNYGAELESEIKAGKTTTIRVNYNLMAAYTHTVTSAGKDTTYSNMLRKPQNTCNISLTTAISKKIFASCNWQFIDKGNDVYWDNATFTSKTVELKSYSLINVYADYTFNKHIKLFGSVQNAANASYTEIAGYNTLGRLFTIGARCSF